MTKEELIDRIEQVAYDGATDGCNQAIIERESEKLADELVKLFATHSVIDTVKEAYQQGFNDGASAAADSIAANSERL